MIWWTAEQALAWIMWRDEARVAEAGDGRAHVLLPRETGQAPDLTEAARSEIIASLLESGSVERQWPDTSKGPYPGRERLIALHNASGCHVAIEVRRKSGGGLPCLLGPLIWWPPQQESRVRFNDAIKQMEAKLKEGEIAAKALIAGSTNDVPMETWLHAMFSLSADKSVGGHMTIDGRQARRLRFDREAIVKLWPGVGPTPVAEAPPEPAQERAKRGRPAYPERDAVIAEMQPLLDQCNGKMSVRDANLAVRGIALSQGLGHLPGSTLRDYRIAAVKLWEDERK